MCSLLLNAMCKKFLITQSYFKQFKSESPKHEINNIFGILIKAFKNNNKERVTESKML